MFGGTQNEAVSERKPSREMRRVPYKELRITRAASDSWPILALHTCGSVTEL
jgi:hypothetical protein